MSRITQEHIFFSFYYLCLGVAFAMSLWCVLEYAKNNDITEVSYQMFDPNLTNTDESQYPSLSLCFMDSYKETSLQTYSIRGGINSTMYSEFLKGNYWDAEMLKVDYDLVTFDIKDYIIGTCMTSTSTSECQNIKQIQASIYPGTLGVLKCFSHVQPIYVPHT